MHPIRVSMHSFAISPVFTFLLNRFLPVAQTLLSATIPSLRSGRFPLALRYEGKRAPFERSNFAQSISSHVGMAFRGRPLLGFLRLVKRPLLPPNCHPDRSGAMFAPLSGGIQARLRPCSQPIPLRILFALNSTQKPPGTCSFPRCPNPQRTRAPHIPASAVLAS